MAENGRPGGFRVYFGEFQTRIDDKGRVTVPARFREVMRELGHAQWFMGRGVAPCVHIYPKPEWDSIREQVNRHSPMNPRVSDFRRLLFSSVSEVRPDPQGRMAVASNLREHAKLDKDVVLIGVENYLELWDREAWQQFKQAKDAEFMAMTAQLFEVEASSGAAARKGTEG